MSGSNIVKSCLLGVCAALMAVGMGGCAAAALPVVADMAGTAVDKGPAMVNAGKMETHQPLGIEEMTKLTQQAAGELALTPTEQKGKGDKISLHYKDDRKQEISVNLVRRTSNTTQIIVDVGWFGDNGLGQLMLWQILHDMPAEAVRGASQGDGAQTRGK